MTDYTSPSVQQRARSQTLSCSEATRFSAWTPLTNKRSNQQLFQERENLILHWFDLWTDGQRRHVLQMLLKRCSKSQLKSVGDYFIKSDPVTRLDFTTALPRALCLYILSFLSPVDLCAAAQVCWYWTFLSEQDCLWAPKCIRHGWFLPYGTSEKEYGAWKKHYVTCVCTLDVLSPREAAELYGTLNQTLPEAQEEEEKRTEHRIRKTICQKIMEHKKADLKSRSPWLSNATLTHTSITTHRSNLLHLTRTSSLVHLGDEVRVKNAFSTKQQRLRFSSTSETSRCSKSLTPSSPRSSIAHPLHHLLLVSSTIPAYEMLLCGVSLDVVPLVYDYTGTTLQSLLCLTEKVTKGRTVSSVGIIAEGNSDEIHLLQGLSITESSILKPDVRVFLEQLCVLVVPASEGGSLNIFVPLAASVTGSALISKLSSLTGLSVRTPTGTCTGSYQHILSEWFGNADFPPLMYLNEALLVSWCRQAEWIEYTLRVLRKHLEPQLQLMSYEIRARTIGHFLWDQIKFPFLNLKSDVMRCLIESLVTLLKETPDNPLEFLGKFLLMKHTHGPANKSDSLTENAYCSFNHELPNTRLAVADRRSGVFMELLNSEKAYVRLLQALHSVYYVPLRAALDSNRAIISSDNLVLVFSPILDILDANSVFLQDLTERSEVWDPLQCVGDLFVWFCTKLRSYTNFFNNYSTALRTIDKCKHLLPVFRAFMKRHSRTLSTRMLSLQEIFLCPSTRVDEYVTILQSLMLHTHPEHPDHTHISSALNTLWNYKNFIHKMKQSVTQQEKLQQVQTMIQGCPNLHEGGRYLISTQDVMLLSCVSEHIATSLRMYECVKELGLFVFNDVVVMTDKTETHVAFSLAVNTTHTFLASVSLHNLRVSDMTDTKYVQNSFLLESPNREWICATDSEEEKIRCLCVLNTAVHCCS